MRYLFFIFFLLSAFLKAQDKLFFSNGTVKKGIIVSNAKDFIYFRTSDTSQVEKISKNKLILMEDYKGNRYLFSPEDTRPDSLHFSKRKLAIPRNSLSIQPLAIFFGRLNFSYERMSKDNKIGFVIPLILTFDPSFGNIFNVIDSSRAHVKGINYITGLDVNFYSDRGTSAKFFVGPRIRYGTDVAFYNTEGYSIQTQFGLKLGNPERKFVQHLSIGFGFVRVLSSAAIRVSDTKQSHVWYSINYRLGVKW